MIEVLQSLAAFLAALGVLVTIHEYGHFWVARRLGVKVIRFSVGFGKPIWRRTFGPDSTELVVGSLPLGGYVKLLDEREGDVAPEECHRAFNRKPPATRAAIVLAGPAANFAFAVCAYWLMYLIGISGPRPIIGAIEPGSIAEQSGLRAGQEVVEIDGHPTPTWDNVFRVALDAVLDARPSSIVYREKGGFERQTSLDFSRLSVDDITQGDFFTEIGFEPLRPTIPPVIGRVVTGERAELAGLLAGDLITMADGRPIRDWIAWVKYVRDHPEQTMTVVVQRGLDEIVLELTPKSVKTEGTTIGRIGAEVAVNDNVEPIPTGIERYSLFAAVPRALQQTMTVTITTLKFLRKMVLGEASVKNLSGPISIAHYAGQSAKLGLSRFLDFLGLVSVSLGVLNLLPIPLLDGGHLLFYLIEFVTRRPVSATVQMYGQQIGLMLLLGLMGLAVFNDIMRIL